MRKLKKKRAKERKRREAEMMSVKREPNESGKSDLDDVQIEYVPEGPAPEMQTDPVFRHFLKVFKHFQQAAPTEAQTAASGAGRDGSTNASGSAEADRKPDIQSDLNALKARAAQNLAEASKDAEDDGANVGKATDAAKLSKKRWKRQNRPNIASLKRVAPRPEVVEYHDVNAREAALLVQLKSVRNSVPVPRHWSAKSRYLQRKRGIEKPPFELPAFIRATGIQEMREALAEKEDKKTLKQRMRERVRPKMGKIDIDYQKLHDAFFRYQTKPPLTAHGELYYEVCPAMLLQRRPFNATALICFVWISGKGVRIAYEGQEAGWAEWFTSHRTGHANRAHQVQVPTTLACRNATLRTAAKLSAPEDSRIERSDSWGSSSFFLCFGIVIRNSR